MRDVIAIDGPSGVGKSTVARLLARRLGWTYLDTGAMYRTVTLAWMHSGTESPTYNDPQWLDALDLDFQEERIYLDGTEVGDAIRAPEVSARVSEPAACPRVRAHLTDMQRRIAGKRPCILDGRDIGTVVFPDAFFKVFLKASARVRAERRWLQMGGEAAAQTLDEVQRDLEARDRADSSRETAPLRQAEDAFAVDTDRHSVEGVVDLLETEARRRLNARGA